MDTGLLDKELLERYKIDLQETVVVAHTPYAVLLDGTFTVSQLVGIAAHMEDLQLNSDGLLERIWDQSA